jgi:hypothetical protein
MLRDRPFEYVVWIDRVAIGRIRTGETQQYPVAPGRHSVSGPYPLRWTPWS